MSGTSIPLGFRPTPNLGPDFGAALADGAKIMQMRQMQQQVQQGNALRDIMSRPGAIDAMGQPTTETMKSVWGVDPNAALKLQQASLTGQTQQAQLQEHQLRRENELQKLIEPARVAGMETYTKAPGDERAKVMAGQKAMTEMLDPLRNGGLLTQAEKDRMNMQFDPIRVGAASTRWQQMQKQRDQEKQAANRGVSTGVDADGRAIIFRPDATDPKMQVTYAGTNDPVPPEKLTGAHKMGGGTGASKDADNAAIDADLQKAHPEWTPGQVKLERMRQAHEATAKPEDPSKGWDLLQDTDGTPYQHKKGTGESKGLDGQPYTPKGAVKLAGPRVASATNQDRDAVVNVARTDYEKELGRPVNLSDVGEKAELDRRVLAAEDKRKADLAGSTTGARVAATGGNDRLAQEKVVRQNLETEYGRPLTTADEPAVAQRVLAAEDARRTALAGSTAGARVAATGGNDRLSQQTIVRQNLTTELGRPLTPADEPAVAARVLAAEDARKTSIGPKPGSAAADHLAIESDVKTRHPEFTPTQIVTETKRLENEAKLLPGSIAANRDAIAADVEADPAFQGKSVGEKAREVENRFQVARQATMNPEVAQNIARQYVATGNQTVLAGFRRSPQMMNEIEKQIIEEQKTQGKTPEQVARQSAEFAAYTQGVKAFEAGGKLEQPVRSQNVAVQHLGVLQDAANQLGNGTFTPLNAVGQKISEMTGHPAPTDFNGVKRIVGTELVKAITGSAGALGDREALDADLKTANSPEQLRSLINRYEQLMAGQLSGLRQTYDRLQTGKSFDETFLAPETRQTISRYERGASQSGAVQPPEGQQAVRSQRQWPAPNGKAVEALKADPAKAALFEQAFGPGSAQKVIGTSPRPTQAAPGQAQPTSQTAAPDRPSTVPPGSAYSPSRKMWRDPSGKMYDADGKQVP